MAYYFNLPKQDDLTADQKLAVEETSSVTLFGGPGTGKSVVGLWKHIRNYSQGRRSLLLTYTKTLQHFLIGACAPRNENASKNIKRTKKWAYSNNKQHYDEIIIDEAQDVKYNLYREVSSHAKVVSYSADPDQSVYLSPSEVKDLLDRLGNEYSANEEYELEKNFRNSREILLFIKAVFPNKKISQAAVNSAPPTGIKPLMAVVGWDENTLFNKIIEVIKRYSSDTHNIGILLPSGDNVIAYYKKLRKRFKGNNEHSQYLDKLTRYESRMEDFKGLGNIHITTFKSAKGLQFNSVIIPNFDSYTWFIKNAERISQNDYYVALSRAETNIFLFCKNRLEGISRETYEKD